MADRHAESLETMNLRLQEELWRSSNLWAQHYQVSSHKLFQDCEFNLDAFKQIFIQFQGDTNINYNLRLDSSTYEFRVVTPVFIEHRARDPKNDLFLTCLDSARGGAFTRKLQHWLGDEGLSKLNKKVIEKFAERHTYLENVRQDRGVAGKSKKSRITNIILARFKASSNLNVNSPFGLFGSYIAQAMITATIELQKGIQVHNLLAQQLERFGVIYRSQRLRAGMILPQ